MSCCITGGFQWSWQGAGNPIGQRGTGTEPDTDRVPDGSRISPAIAFNGSACNRVAIDVEIIGDEGVDDIKSQFHDVAVERRESGVSIGLREGTALANRDFQLSWTAPGDLTRGVMQVQRTERGDYFTLTVEPPDTADEASVAARDVVFVIDTSGSMAGEPLAIAKRGVRRAIAGLRPDDALMLIDFSDTARAMSGGLVPNTAENRAQGYAYVDALQSTGGTMVLEGITEALGNTRRPGRVPIIVFLTDGFIGNEPEIFSAIAEKIGDARIFSLGVGTSVNRYLLDGMAKIGRGAAAYAAPGVDPEPAIAQLLERIAAPVLTDLEIDWGGVAVTDVVPAKLPDVFLGQSVAVFGRLESMPVGAVTLRGRRAGEPVAIQIPIAIAGSKFTGGLATAWARRKVDELMLSPDAMSSERDRVPSLEAEITQLGLAHRVMTPYTAFVAVDVRATAAGASETLAVPSELSAGTFGDEMGEFLGAGRLGLVGVGRGGGGSGDLFGTIGVGYGRSTAAGFGGRGTRVPKVRFMKPKASGALDRDIIHRIVRAHVTEIRHCYREGLSDAPTLAGRVVIRFVIEEGGSVSTAEIAHSSLGHAAVEGCITTAVQGWRFPTGDKVTSVTYPLSLSP